MLISLKSINSYLTVTVEGYDSKGVTQCYQCQKFNHTASNCHVKPKCLKCGEAHQTADYQIKKVDTMYCVNCEAYGHMANYSKCPLYPKPHKGAVVKPNYSNVINSLVRPNTSFTQVAQQIQATVKPSAPQKMTSHVGQVPITNQTQTQAIRMQIPPQPPPINTNNDYFALISNLNFPYNIESISELSSDHNPVMLSFTLTSTIHKHNPRAITTCWSAFSSNLKNQIHLSDFSKIHSPQSLEEKLTKFTDAVSSAHNSASKPITNKRHSYTPQHIKDLIARKNRARKLFQRTNPLHRTEANRLQGTIKKELRLHSQNTWSAKLASLETQDYSLWHMQKHFRKKRLKHSKSNKLFRLCWQR
ncbi:PRE_C2HC domain-containing protein [Trichonephila clavipes]|nr:PRE_C2HC domain-containing protein [Trichonephila clavipes]